jgi:site-specific DNA-adenine methylase
MPLNDIKQALSQLSQHKADAWRKEYAKNHMTAADHERVARALERTSASNRIPLRDRVVTQQRKQHDIPSATPNKTNGNTRSISDRVHRRRKDKPVLDSAKVDALSRLHSRLSNLGDDG